MQHLKIPGVQEGAELGAQLGAGHRRDRMGFMRAVAGLLVWMGLMGTALAAPAGSFFTLMDRADAVIVAEIQSLDDSQESMEGPLVARARVEKILKGEQLMTGQLIRIAEPRWWAAHYQTGQQRILFLQRGLERDDIRDSRWQVDTAGGVEFLINDGISPKEIGHHGFARFIREIQQARDGALFAKFRPQVVMREEDPRTLRILLENISEDIVWFNPSLMEFYFEAAGTRYTRPIFWDYYQEGAWVDLWPGSTFDGAVEVHVAG
ncbi:MAG: hypothetical protein JW937_08530, partial [Candidatus Omnitrophica bacterium]|nr:hypothetical protein [Candidatus Omnitrophota bacterium]